jgi:hypothetical protein
MKFLGLSLLENVLSGAAEPDLACSGINAHSLAEEWRNVMLSLVGFSNLPGQL